MALFGVIGCLMFITCFATTKERVQPIKEQNPEHRAGRENTIS